MFLKKLLATLLLSGLVFLGWGQDKKANYWYFGNQAGLDFTNGAPMPILGGQISTLEGCSVISSDEGELLFYTDGITVWNKTHQVMSYGLGLMGNSSSTQSAIIVPHPGDPDLYYIFTVDAEENGLLNGFRYSVVDMSLEGGLGKVTNQKNILLSNWSLEKVTAVEHGSEEGYWVVIHLFGSNEFRSYRVDHNGIDPNPVVSMVGDVINGTYDNAKGYLKISPDGKWLVMANNTTNTSLIFHFDNLTGKVSRQIRDALWNYNQYPYGVEFSANSEMLYICDWNWDNDTTRIYQYKLTDTSAFSILSSRNEVAADLELFGAMQLAPDGKIYLAHSHKRYVGVINNPNAYGVNCDVELMSLYLSGAQSIWGLPPFIQSIFNASADFSFEDLCDGALTHFYDVCSQTPDSIRWDFGDPASGSANSSTQHDPTHLYSTSGNYEVILTAYFEQGTDSAVQQVEIRARPAVDLGADTAICEGHTLPMDAGSGYASYLWQNGYNGQMLTTDTAGLFYVAVTDVYGCIGIDSIEVTVRPILHMTIDTAICRGEAVTIGGNQYTVNGTYHDTLTSLWGCDSILITQLMVNDTFRIQMPMSACAGDAVWVGGSWQTQSGTYTDNLHTVCGCDSIVVTELTFDDVIHLQRQANICQGDSLFVGGDWQKMAGSYLDSAVSAFGCDSLTTTELSIHPLWFQLRDTTICEGDSVLIGSSYFLDEGDYPEYYLSTFGCDSSLVTRLLLQHSPQVWLGNDTTLEMGQTLLLEASFPGATTQWQDGSNASSYTVSQAGDYFVTLDNDCGSASDTIVIQYHEVSNIMSVPNAFTPDGDGLNDTFAPLFSVAPTNYLLLVYDRWGMLVFSTSEPSVGWNGYCREKPCEKGSYVYTIRYTEPNNPATRTFSGNVILLR